MNLSDETRGIYGEFVKAGLGGTITSWYDPEKEIFFLEWTHGPYPPNPLKNTTIHSHKQMSISDGLKDGFLRDFVRVWVEEIRKLLEQLELQTKQNS